MAHPYFWSSGFNVTGNNRVVYEDWETIQLNATVLSGSTYTWNFYNSLTGSLISTTSGASPSVSFSTVQGESGIDVELITDFGICRTRHYKRHRFVIYPDCRVPTKTINLSLGTGDTSITSLGGTQYQIDIGSGIAKLIGSINTERIKFVGSGIAYCESAATITKTGATYDDAVQLQETCKIYSRKDASSVPYLTLDGGGFGTPAGTNGVLSHKGIRISGCQIQNCQSAGIKLKLDSVNRFTGAGEVMADIWIFDNIIDAPTNEGTYIGYEAAAGYRFDAAFNGGDYHHAVRRLKIWANEFKNTGWDGMQCTGADEDTEIHDNYYENTATSETFAQNFAMSCGGGFAGQIYNNVFDRCIQVFAHKTTYIYNNYIPGLNSPSIVNAIFVRRTDNPMTLGPNGDSYQHCDPLADLFVFNNLPTSVQDLLYILKVNDGGTGAIALRSVYYFNNTGSWTGTPSEGDLKLSESTEVVVKSNLILPSIADAKINNAPTDLSCQITGDVHLDTNIGIDITQYVTESNLKVGLTDITGQSYPLNGIFKRLPVQRFTGYVIPQTNETQIQWYQTNQVDDTSGYSDKVKLTDMNGAKVKTYTKISGSAKPRLVASVRPVAKTGNLTGVETFDNVSN
jgi:hypothetical protein